MLDQHAVDAVGHVLDAVDHLTVTEVDLRHHESQSCLVRCVAVADRGYDVGDLLDFEAFDYRRLRQIHVVDGVKAVFDQIESKEETVHAYLDLYKKEGYVSRDYYENDANIKAAVDFIVSEDLVKVGDKERLERLYKELISKDWFMTLIDLAEYIEKKEEVYAAYEDQDAWNKKVVYNIAKAGFFSSDRTIEQYDKDIWHTKY